MVAPSYKPSPLAALSARLAPGCTIKYFADTTTDPSALAFAKNATVAIVYCVCDAHEESTVVWAWV
eukprot:m.474593 g.474593  ORF g.474593 m.474593 type:complete len:66 (+) comp21677_c1_seq2:575-772(+)